jgi:hypothetical protein
LQEHRKQLLNSFFVLELELVLDSLKADEVFILPLTNNSLAASTFRKVRDQKSRILQLLNSCNS